jgi:RNA-binding protein
MRAVRAGFNAELARTGVRPADDLPWPAPPGLVAAPTGRGASASPEAVGATILHTCRMALSEKQARFLRGKAHPLKPIIRIGNAGLTPAVSAEAVRALHDHELVKVKVHGAEREQRDAWIAALCVATGSELVQRIGHVATLYKARDPLPRLVLPD